MAAEVIAGRPAAFDPRGVPAVVLCTGGRTELTGFQASARGGLVQVRPSGDRVLLGGQAVTVLRGQLV